MDIVKQRTNRKAKKKLAIAIRVLIYENETTEKQYPITTASYHILDNGRYLECKGVVLKNDKDLDQWFDSWQEKHEIIYYNDFLLVGRWSYIFDQEIDEWIMRYNLLKNNNIPSYSNLLDELPAIWAEVLAFINKQIDKAIKENKDG